jgi:hypothetical protein
MGQEEGHSRTCVVSSLKMYRLGFIMGNIRHFTKLLASTPQRYEGHERKRKPEEPFLIG